MAWHTWDADRWYAGTADAEVDACTTIEPPTASTDATVGEPRARWHRYEWRVEPYSARQAPESTTLFRFIQALDDVLNITESQVEAAIAAMPEGRAKRRMRAWWRVSSAVARRGQAMNEFQALLGLSNAQIRSVFTAAEQVAD